MNQRIQLAKPFLSKFVHTNPSGGGSYVSHDVVTQYLLRIVGPYTFEVAHILRGHVDALAPNPNGKSAKAKAGSPALTDAIVGVICRLTVTIDGTTISVEEVGDCESPHNWPHDGARMKDAMSDSIKRCAMRLGLGLHLWSQEEYILWEALQKDEQERSRQTGGGSSILAEGVVGQGGSGLVGANPESPAFEGTINA